MSLKQRIEQRKLKVMALLAERVEVDDNGCWLLPATRHGYASLQDGSAHKVVFQLFNGPVPRGLMVCHHCDVRNCCNPAHLYAGTAKENAADCNARHPNPPRLNIIPFQKRKTA